MNQMAGCLAASQNQCLIKLTLKFYHVGWQQRDTVNCDFDIKQQFSPCGHYHKALRTYKRVNSHQIFHSTTNKRQNES